MKWKILSDGLNFFFFFRKITTSTHTHKIITNFNHFNLGHFFHAPINVIDCMKLIENHLFKIKKELEISSLEFNVTLTASEISVRRIR